MPWRSKAIHPSQEKAEMTVSTQEKITILRRKQVELRTGLSRSSIYQRISDGAFPSPIRIGAKAVGWVEAEIDDWLKGQLHATRGGAHG